MFEYGAFDKPIIAGVGGFAAQFVEKNIPNHILFKPVDVDDFVSQMKAYQLKFERRDEFIKNFSRRSIDEKLAASILSVLKR